MARNSETFTDIFNSKIALMDRSVINKEIHIFRGTRKLRGFWRINGLQ